MPSPEPKPQVDPRSIIHAIRANLEASRVALNYRALVPAYFEVILHPAVYARFEPILPAIAEDAYRVLDEQLDAWNAKPPLRALLDRLGADAAPPVERTGAAWTIVFFPDPNGVLEEYRLTVASRMERIPQGKASGHHTQKVYTEYDTGATAPTSRTEIEPAPALSAAASALARLRIHEGDAPSRVVYMERPEISLGRGGDGYWVDVQIRHAGTVSKEHARIRYVSLERKFELQHLGSNKTVVDGIPMPRGEWKPLAPAARIELSGGVHIDFETMVEQG